MKNMISFRIKSTLGNEEGSIIVIGMIVLVLLTMFGLSSVTTSNIEMQIAANERMHKKAFYVAESGWQLAVGWIDDQYPLPVTDSLIDLTAAAGTVSYSSNSGTPTSNIAWDKDNSVSAEIDFVTARQAEGYSAGFYRYTYDIKATASGPRDTEARIEVRAGKIDAIGL